MMKKLSCLAFVFLIALSGLARAVKPAPPPTDEIKRVTLYAPNKPQRGSSKFFYYSFRTGKFVQDPLPWDLNYGSLYVGEDFDWFSVSTIRDARSAFRDLGALAWTDVFTVPVITPFPKLKEGEQRTFTVDASGADGADGAPGADGDGIVRERAYPEPASAKPRPPKHDGVPKVDPIFAKAIVGHMYVIRVVDNDSDFYVLFRVEAIERGVSCTISWKRIASPAEGGI
jgi:hypothetical protein